VGRRGKRAIVPIVTRDAAELMDARLTEYIAAYAAAAAAAEADVKLAEAFIRAYNDRDVPTLHSVAADPPALFADIADASDPTTHFAWLDAFDWRWEEPECDVDGAGVVCLVHVRNKLTDASGVERWDVIRFSTADGLVEDMTEVNDDDEYWARALEPFVEWVAATYPEDLRVMWTFGSGIAPNQNDTTIPLFAAHLDEWSSSDPLPTPAHRAFVAAQAGGDLETMSGLLAPDVVVDQLWASSVEELPHLSRLLTGLAWDWNIQSCSISAQPGIACVADPTWRLDDRDIGASPLVVEFEITSAGIASVSTGTWFERSAAGLAPLFEWIRAAHPEAAGSLLAERDGTTVPVLSDAAVGQLLDLVDEFLTDA
jgi:hypothetical protein